MPVIPQADDNRNYYPENPVGTDVRATLFGHDAQALAALGGEIGDFGSKLMTARKRAAENDAISKAHLSDVQWLADTSQQMLLNYTKKDENGQPLVGPDGQIQYDPDGFAEAMRQKMDDRRAQQMKSMPTGDAAQSYMDTTNRIFGETYAQSLHWENVTKALTYKKNFEIRNNADANYLINQQNPDNAISFTKNSVDAFRDELNRSIGTVNTADEAQQLFREGAKTRVKALFDGLTNNATSARVGLHLIDSITSGEPRDYKTGDVIPGTKLDAKLVQDSLTPDEITHIRHNLEAKVKEGNHDRVVELEGWLRDQHAILTSTNNTDLARFNGAEAVSNLKEMQQMANDGTIPKRSYEEALVNLTMGKSYALVRRDFAMMPDSQKALFDKRIEDNYKAELAAMGVPDGFALEHKKDYQHLNEMVWKNLQKQRGDDIAAYVEAYGKNPSGTVQGGIPDEDRVRWRMGQARSIGYQGEALAMPEITSLATDLKNKAGTNPQAAAAQLESFKSRMGGFAGQGMKELAENGKLPGYFQTAFEMDSPDAAMSIIQNHEPKTKAALEKTLSHTDRTAMETAVDSQLKEFRSPVVASGGLVTSQNIKQAVMLEAMRQREENGFNITRAVAAAKERIVDSQYHVLSSSAFMPRKIGTVQTDPDNVKAAMQAIYDPVYQAKIGVQIPGSANKFYLGRDTLMARRDIAISNGKWITNPDNLGATFVVPVGVGKSIVMAKPVDKDGKPITIDFVSASKDPSPEALAEKRTWWDVAGAAMSSAGQGVSSASSAAAKKVAGQMTSNAAQASESFDKTADQSDTGNIKMSQAQLDVIKDPSLVKSQRVAIEDWKNPATGKIEKKKFTHTTLKDGREIKMMGDELGKQ